jgi:hypothetical protein
MERRDKPRIYVPFIAKVRGRDAKGQVFKADMVTQNISSSGMYLRLTQQVKEGTKLLVLILLRPAGRIAIRGDVVRVEPGRDGGFGVAMHITQHRFL